MSEVVTMIFRVGISILLATPVWFLIDTAIAEFKCSEYRLMTFDLSMAGMIIVFISVLWYGV